MLSPKMAALCLCPALVATPAVIATHPKMRHAVAHFVHRAADRIESPAALAAAEPFGHCPASYADESPGDLSSGSPAGLSNLSPQNISALQNGNLPVGPNSKFSSPTDSFTGPVSGIGPGSGIAGPGVPGTPVPGTGIVIPPTTTEGVTEPQNWALLIIGFAATGLLLRWRRPKPV